MKRKMVIFAFVASVALFCIISINVKNKNSTSPVSLTNEEILKLRETYPINDQLPELADMREATLEEWIDICDNYIEVEVISEPVKYIKNITIDPDSAEGVVYQKAGGVTGVEFIKYEVRIVNDILDNLQDNTIEITYNSMFDVGMPTMDVGSRYVIGGVYNSKNKMLEVGSDTMFYVTEEGYVLSVKSEVTKNRHTGSKIENLVDYIKREKSR